MLRKRWGDPKARLNLEKHGVPFEEADTVFRDRLAVTCDDATHSAGEDRHLIIGMSDRRRLLVVVFTVLDDGEPWLISARPAEKFEKRRYTVGDSLRDAVIREDDMEDDLEDVYVPPFDFSRGVRGAAYRPFYGIRVLLDQDVAEYFPDDDKVNDALRILIAEGRAKKQPPPLHPSLV